jgi:hypothetical protein
MSRRWAKRDSKNKGVGNGEFGTRSINGVFQGGESWVTWKPHWSRRKISIGGSQWDEKEGTYSDNPTSTMFVCQINTTRCERSAELNIEGAL